MAGNYSLSRLTVTINGRVLTDLASGMDPENPDAAPTGITGGGRKRVGFNEFPAANGIDYEFAVTSPSPDERFLDDLAESSADVTLIASYAETDAWPDGAFTGVTTKGKLVRAGRALGDEIDAKSYTVMGIGFTRTYKGSASIVKG